MYSVPKKLKCHVIVSVEVQCYCSVLRIVRSRPGCMQFVQNVLKISYFGSNGHPLCSSSPLFCHLGQFAFDISTLQLINRGNTVQCA